MSKCTKKAEDEIKKSLQEYPGAAMDAADDDKVSREMVDQETKELNNNPRNNGDIIDPK